MNIVRSREKECKRERRGRTREMTDKEKEEGNSIFRKKKNDQVKEKRKKSSFNFQDLIHRLWKYP